MKISDLVGRPTWLAIDRCFLIRKLSLRSAVTFSQIKKITQPFKLDFFWWKNSAKKYCVKNASNI